MIPIVRGSDLSDRQVADLHKLIKPTDVESAFLTIPWETSIHAARVKAAQEGKPMLLFMIHGHLLSGV